tara:strand:+ start:252 stop:713 length:462 start_codon:yes stop_codon:yes gene_type:complete
MLKFAYMEKLNFKSYPLIIKNNENKQYVFDEIRKKNILLTPEEWVRQNCVQFLIHEKKYPKSLISVEKKLSINSLTKRYDIVVFNSNGIITLVVECKSPKVKITQKTFDQISTYNLAFKSLHLMITNGLRHYFCKVDYVKNKLFFLNELPSYK